MRVKFWEAAMTAAKYKIDNMTVFLDRNFIQQDSYTEKIMPLDEELLGNDLSEMWKTQADGRLETSGGLLVGMLSK